MKKFIIFSALVLLSTPQIASADAGFMDYGMMGGYSGMGIFGMGLVGLIYFAIGAFVFSVIFWLTHNWISKK